MIEKGNKEAVLDGSAVQDMDTINNEIVDKAIGYIYDNMNNSVTLEDVCRYCHISKYYFSRIFKEATGESVYAFIKRLKLEQTAFRMKAERARSITDIAEEYGYSSSNYSTAFRQQMSMSPVAYRKMLVEKVPGHPFVKDEISLGSFEDCKEKTEIVVLPEIRVLYERHIGRYNDMKKTWCEFTEKYSSYVNESTIFYECTYDDPTITSADTCVYDLCMSIGDDCELQNIKYLNGGRFLVYHFEGHVDELFAVYQTLFYVYFPKMNFEIDSRYGYDRYYYFKDFSGKIDIHLPIK